MTNTRELKSRMALLGIGVKDLAEKLNVSYASASRKASGKAYFTAPELKIMCDLLEIDDYETLELLFFCE